MEAYLDNAATTKAFTSVKDIMVEALINDYGNPSSMHGKGFDAEKYIRAAKENIADVIKCKESEILFTSGGTESNNMALIGTALCNRRSGNHIISTVFEHPSVYEPLCFLEKNGYRVSYIHVDSNGHLDLEELKNEICEDTILVSTMFVNNEIGSIQKIKEISEIIKEKNANIYYHVDAIQAFGKLKIVPKRLGIDLMSVSGHKIHGPKGVGFLYINDRVKISPILFGGGQQKSMRSGTENVPGIAGLGQAVKEIYMDHSSKQERLYGLKSSFIQQIRSMEGVSINGIHEIEIRDTAPHVVSVSFDGIKSEVLLHALEDKGVYVSAGSACSSNHPSISGTLKAIGVKRELLDSTLRFSFSVLTTQEEVDYTCQMLQELVPVFSRYRRH